MMASLLVLETGNLDLISVEILLSKMMISKLGLELRAMISVSILGDKESRESALMRRRFFLW